MPQAPDAPAQTAACLNPGCMNTVVWSLGRPTQFCSNRCARAAGRVITRLAAQVAVLDDTLTTSLTSRQRVALERERLRIGWQLQRYAGCLLSPDAAAALTVGSGR